MKVVTLFTSLEKKVHPPRLTGEEDNLALRARLPNSYGELYP